MQAPFPDIGAKTLNYVSTVLLCFAGHSIRPGTVDFLSADRLKGPDTEIVAFVLLKF